MKKETSINKNAGLQRKVDCEITHELRLYIIGHVIHLLGKELIMKVREGKNMAKKMEVGWAVQ